MKELSKLKKGKKIKNVRGERGDGKKADRGYSSRTVKNAQCYWSKQYGIVMADSEILTINRNLSGFFKVLKKWQMLENIKKNELS